MTAALLSAASILALANLMVTTRVCRSGSYTPRQKVLQTLIVWLLPILGFVAVWAFVSQVSERHANHYPDRTGGEGSYTQGSGWVEGDGGGGGGGDGGD